MSATLDKEKGIVFVSVVVMSSINSMCVPIIKKKRFNCCKYFSQFYCVGTKDLSDFVSLDFWNYLQLLIELIILEV